MFPLIIDEKHDERGNLIWCENEKGQTEEYKYDENNL